MDTVSLCAELVNVKRIPNDQRKKKSSEIWNSLVKLGELQCRCCKEVKPLDFFHEKKKANIKSGYKAYDNMCKTCRANRLYDLRRTRYNTLDRAINEIVFGIKRRSGVELSKSYVMDLYNKQNGLCYYTGIKMIPDINSLFKVSADRIDSNQSYVDGNIVLCCWSINNMKQDLSIDDFKMLISNLYNNYVVGKEK